MKTILLILIAAVTFSACDKPEADEYNVIQNTGTEPIYINYVMLKPNEKGMFQKLEGGYYIVCAAPDGCQYTINGKTVNVKGNGND